MSPQPSSTVCGPRFVFPTANEYYFHQRDRLEFTTLSYPTRTTSTDKIAWNSFTGTPRSQARWILVTSPSWLALRLLLGPHACRRCPQDNLSHSPRAVQNPGDTLWPHKCTGHLPSIDELNSAVVPSSLSWFSLTTSSFTAPHGLSTFGIYTWVLQCIADHHLFLKRSKCSIAASSVAYLRHVISGRGIAMDNDKVQAVLSWPVPKTVRAVRGFLGLAGYYQHFFRDYGTITASLTRLPCEEAAFYALCKALTQAPILQLPNFQHQFMLVCDPPNRPTTSEAGSLQTQTHRAGAGRATLAPIPLGLHLNRKTNHRSLKFLMDQCLAMIPQLQWASKLIRYDFTVQFKPGHANVMANALLRRDTDKLTESPTCSALSGPHGQHTGTGRGGHKQLNLYRGLLLKRTRCLSSRHPLWSLLSLPMPMVQDMKESRRYFTGSALRSIFPVCSRVCDHVFSCRNKTEQLRTGGLLQPLAVSSAVWSDIAMDFIEGLPRVHGKTIILTVVDKFSKFPDFIPLAHPYTATTVARAFFAEIVHLHGTPASIISDRDPLDMSSAFRPQSDGQSEVTNKIITMYLRCLSASLGTSPFRVIYGREPPTVREYDASLTKLLAVDQQLRDRNE
ncbi:hypothetical protein U9M48_008617 [Paspalum notatum var. saurae]|uniref:Integrase catalytic domain-containing protein n=1 Tax=Paspalum notatum var. saurae TaxID=547442 RepID=A0AAQ3SPF7_PASNO